MCCVYVCAHVCVCVYMCVLACMRVHVYTMDNITSGGRGQRTTLRFSPFTMRSKDRILVTVESSKCL